VKVVFTPEEAISLDALVEAGTQDETQSHHPLDVAERIRLNRERAQTLIKYKERERQQQIEFKREEDELEQLLELESSIEYAVKSAYSQAMLQPALITSDGEKVFCTELLLNGSVCGQLIGQMELESLYQPFGESICHACKVNNSKVFETVSKDQVHREYLVPLDTIKYMRYMEKVNPRHPNWTPMRLYLRKHAREQAYKRFGNQEGLEAELKKRESCKFERDMKNTENFFEKAKLTLLLEEGDVSAEAEETVLDEHTMRKAKSTPVSTESFSSGGFLVDDEDSSAPDLETSGPTEGATALKRKAKSLTSAKAGKSHKSLFAAVAKSIKGSHG
jgi:hypothetical protein